MRTAMTICSACGHALTPDGPCGLASITVGEKTTYLCHADDHSCYAQHPDLFGGEPLSDPPEKSAMEASDE